MKAFLNVFLIIVIVAIVIPLGQCKPGIYPIDISSPEEVTSSRSTNVNTTTIESDPIPNTRHFIRAPARNVKLPCLPGEKHDPQGICRKVL